MLKTKPVKLFRIRYNGQSASSISFPGLGIFNRASKDDVEDYLDVSADAAANLNQASRDLDSAFPDHDQKKVKDRAALDKTLGVARTLLKLYKTPKAMALELLLRTILSGGGSAGDAATAAKGLSTFAGEVAAGRDLGRNPQLLFPHDDGPVSYYAAIAPAQLRDLRLSSYFEVDEIEVDAEALRDLPPEVVKEHLTAQRREAARSRGLGDLLKAAEEKRPKTPEKPKKS